MLVFNFIVKKVVVCCCLLLFASGATCASTASDTFYDDGTWPKIYLSERDKLLDDGTWPKIYLSERDKLLKEYAFRSETSLQYQQFKNTCKAFFTRFAKMDIKDLRLVTDAVAKVPSAMWNTEFVKVCDFFFARNMKGQDCSKIIAALGTVPVEKLEFFKNICGQMFTNDMTDKKRIGIVSGLAEVPSELWENGAFKNTCAALCTSANGGDYSDIIIKAVARLNPLLYEVLLRFIQTNERFFGFVPASAFSQIITEGIQERELQGSLERLIIQYYPEHNLPNHFRNIRPAAPGGIATDIHHMAGLEVTSAAKKTTFNEAVVHRVNELIEDVPRIDYEMAIALMRSVLLELQADTTNTGSQHLSNEIFEWAVQCVGSNEIDKSSLISVVIFLSDKLTKSDFKLWLYTFLKESHGAYDRNNSKSCVMGVRERVVTSLRNIPISDRQLLSIFTQAESTKMLSAKKAKLGDFSFWAKQLFNRNIRSHSSPEEAKSTYKMLLNVYFSDVKNDQTAEDIADSIETMTDPDSFDSMWDHKLLPAIRELDASVTTAAAVAAP